MKAKYLSLRFGSAVMVFLLIGVFWAHSCRAEHIDGNKTLANSFSAKHSDFRVTGYEAQENLHVNAPATIIAENASHKFTIHYTAQGPSVTSRDNNSSWKWGLELASIAGKLPPVTEIRKDSLNEKRVNYRRADGVVEWYVNDKFGLEQGYTIETP